ncbi:MAG: lipoprotein [Steroidobacteraceae bacterium]|nr:lipoprotein [Steroidobacteraceae bacterium]
MRLAALAAAALLAACGQTGQLYMPDEGVTTPVEIRGPGTAAPAPAPEEDEKEKKTEPPPGS